MSDSEEELTIAEPSVVTKYRTAGDIANKAMKACVEACVSGASVLSICKLGDSIITEETGKVYNKGKVSKGSAFPTCVSVNEVICHFSPLASEEEVLLKDGDIVKIDMGAQIDGYIGVVAHTVAVGHSANNPVTGKKADVMMAAYKCSEAALRLLKPDTENTVVTEAISNISGSFDCKAVQGMLSYELKRNVIDGDKAIIQNPDENQKHDKCKIEVNDVFAVDVLISSGEGKAKRAEDRTTVYKKTNQVYSLKMKASRAVFSEVQTKFGMMPFTLRNLEDEKKARMGLVECCKHNVMEKFDVLHEKEGEFVAQFKFTALVTANGTIRITQGPFDEAAIKTERKVEDPEMVKLLNTSAKGKSKNKKKKEAKETKA